MRWEQQPFRVCMIFRAQRTWEHTSPQGKVSVKIIFDNYNHHPCVNCTAPLSFWPLQRQRKGTDAAPRGSCTGNEWSAVLLCIPSGASHIQTHQGETAHVAMQSPHQSPSSTYQTPTRFSCFARPLVQTTWNCRLQVTQGGSSWVPWKHQPPENVLMHLFHRTSWKNPGFLCLTDQSC